MIAYGKRSRGERTRRALAVGAEAPYYKSEWMACGQDPWLSPTIFMVEQPPGSELPTHFHRQNEFQVVVQGGGAIGKHAVSPISVHYAGAYTGYGPVTAGANGLSYFTIRPVFDTGVLLAAEARTKMIRGPKRQVHASPYEATPLAAAKNGSGAVLIEPGEDGLFCGVAYLGAGGGLETGFHPDSGGTFYLVLEGSLEVAGERLGLWESAYLSAHEPSMNLQAGPEGAAVLVMRCPPTAPAYLPAKEGVRHATAA